MNWLRQMKPMLVMWYLQQNTHSVAATGERAKYSMRHSTKKLDLTGEKYGRLTVLTPAENIGRRTAWLCRCECGKETVVLTSRLRSGHTKSCGCAFQHTVRPAYCRP